MTWQVPHRGKTKVVKQRKRCCCFVLPHLFYHEWYSKLVLSQSFATDKYVLLSSRNTIFCFSMFYHRVFYQIRCSKTKVNNLLCTFCRWFSNDPLVVINRSSMYSLTKLKSANKLDIFSWNMSGLFDKPIGRT